MLTQVDYDNAIVRKLDGDLGQSEIEVPLDNLYLLFCHITDGDKLDETRVDVRASGSRVTEPNWNEGVDANHTLLVQTIEDLSTDDAATVEVRGRLGPKFNNDPVLFDTCFLCSERFEEATRDLTLGPVARGDPV